MESTKTKDEIDQAIQEFIASTKKLSWRNEVRCFFAVWTFLTRLPGPTFVDYQNHYPGYLIKGMVYFPIVGTLIGYWIATFYCFAHVSLTIPPLIASAIALESSFWITGRFHDDRLGETANGFGSGWSRSQMLKTITDTRLWSYGYIALIIYIFTKVHSYRVLGIIADEMGKGSTILTNGIIVSQTLTRLLAVYMIKTNPFIDKSDDGPKTLYYHYYLVSAKYLVSYQRLLVAIVYCFGLVALLYQSFVFAFALVGIVLISGHYAGRCRTYIFGGITNDFVGATICVVEIIVLYCIFYEEQLVDLVERTIPKIVYQIETLIDTMRQEDIWNIIKDLSFQKVWKNEQFQSFVQFVVMIILCKVWCDNVGHPNVVVQDVANPNTENNSNISVNATEIEIKNNTQTETGDQQTTAGESMVVEEEESNKSVIEESKKSR